jgi:hypothetical protein
VRFLCLSLRRINGSQCVEIRKSVIRHHPWNGFGLSDSFQELLAYGTTVGDPISSRLRTLFRVDESILGLYKRPLNTEPTVIRRLIPGHLLALGRFFAHVPGLAAKRATSRSCLGVMKGFVTVTPFHVKPS